MSKKWSWLLLLLAAHHCVALPATPLPAACHRVLGAAATEPSQLPRTFAELEAHFRGKTFVTRRQNRVYRNNFSVAASKGYLALSIDFPIVTQLNNIFQNKPRTATVFALYKHLLFENLKKDPILWDNLMTVRDGTKVFYADYKNVGLIFAKDTPEIRAAILALQERTSLDFEAATSHIPELRALEESGRGILRNRRSWVNFGLGASPLEATATSRLARYHSPRTGIAAPREFRDPAVQAELRQKFTELDLNRRAVVSLIQEIDRAAGTTSGMLDRTHQPNGAWIPSTRLWDILRGIEATDVESYRQAVREGIRTEFRMRQPISDDLVDKLQAYYHLLDTFLPRVHERREMDIGVTEARSGAVYVDVRGQTPRNLFRMASELANVAEGFGLSHPDLVERAAQGVRTGQDEASRKFVKLRRQIKLLARTVGFAGEVRISGDEIVITLSPDATESQFRSYVATAGHLGLPIRVVLVAGGTVSPSGIHISAGEKFEKNLRKKLKTTRFPVEDWDGLTMGVRIVPSSSMSGTMQLYLSEREGTNVISRARPLIERWLANPSTAAELLPEDFRYLGVINAHDGAARTTSAPLVGPTPVRLSIP